MAIIPSTSNVNAIQKETVRKIKPPSVAGIKPVGMPSLKPPSLPAPTAVGRYRSFRRM